MGVIYYVENEKPRIDTCLTSSSRRTALYPDRHIPHTYHFMGCHLRIAHFCSIGFCKVVTFGTLLQVHSGN